MTGKKSAKFRNWGGRREGAGRPRLASRPTVAHRRRSKHLGKHPVHVTLRVRDGLSSLRERRLMALVIKCVQLASKPVFRVTHFTAQKEQLHFIVRTRDTDNLTRGMQGLAIRIARGINAVLEIHGKLWADRFRARDLTTPAEVRKTMTSLDFEPVG